MGNRISISFKQGKSESVTLFSHWGGRTLIDDVKDYLAELQEYRLSDENHDRTPLSRMEPRVVMLDFIRWLTAGEPRVEDDYYLGKNSSDGDNSDNGHRVIDLDEWMPIEESPD